MRGLISRVALLQLIGSTLMLVLGINKGTHFDSRRSCDRGHRGRLGDYSLKRRQKKIINSKNSPSEICDFQLEVDVELPFNIKNGPTN